MNDAPEMTTPDTGETTSTTAQQLGTGSVEIYTDSQYQGREWSLGIGFYDWGQIPNDAISSLRIAPGMVAVLYGDTHFQGALTVLFQDTPYVGNEWNDQVSSMIVTQPSHWNCYTRDGRYRGTVNPFWFYQDDPSDAAAECDHQLDICATDGGCVASGDGITRSCDVTSRVDGCSIPLNDPTSQWLKDVFRDACNAHDYCYHAPYGAIGAGGFDLCNQNFWNDMQSACDSQPWYNQLGCRTGASVWADAMNFEPGRTTFWNSFMSDQEWVSNNCYQ